MELAQGTRSRMQCTGRGAIRQTPALWPPSMPRTVSRRGPSRLVVFGSDDRDAGFTDDSNRKAQQRLDKEQQRLDKVQQRLDKLDVEAEKVAQKLDDAWADLRKHPRRKIPREIVQSLQKQKADLDERRKLLEAQLSGVGTAVASVSGAGDTMELSQLLCNHTLPAVAYQRSLSRSGTSSTHARRPKELLSWENFKADANAWGQRQAQSLAGLTATPSLLRGTFNAWDETALYSINDSYMAPVLNALWSSGRLGEQCKLEVVSGAARVTGDPDRCIVLPSGKVLVPIEIKHRFALPSDMAPLYQLQLVDKEKTALQKHVEQLFGYVFGNDTTYGILASDVEYYFCKVHGETMSISDAIKHNALGPSVITCICYVVHLAQLLQPGQAEGTGSPPDGSLGSSEMLGVHGDSLDAAGPAGSAAAHEGDGDGSPPSRQSWSAATGLMQPSVISAAAWHLGVTLGSGITGTVSSGLSPLGLPVAIKVPSREGRRKQGRKAQLQQLQNEVHTMHVLSPLQGVIFPRLVAYGTLVSRANDHFPCVVTELLQGAVPLSKVGAEQLPVTLEADAMTLLDALHAHGVAHCDISGDNLFLMPDGTLRLIDFGHASLNASPEAMARDVEDLRYLLAALQKA